MNSDLSGRNVNPTISEPVRLVNEIKKPILITDTLPSNCMNILLTPSILLSSVLNAALCVLIVERITCEN
jgi:hypothetical protein